MTREEIPADIRRRVRQRCGFGCVLCGSPIYDYDHIEQYSEVKEHTYENLVLLCPTCHRKKTKGIISKAKIIEAINEAEKRERTSSDEIPAEPYTMDIGGNIIQTFSGIVFQIYEFGVLGVVFKNVPLINAEILDGNGRSAIEIRENEYTLSSTTWDIEFVGKTLTFRNGPRKVFCSISIDGELKTISVRGSVILSNGIRIDIKDNGIFANLKLLAFSNEIANTGAALTITDQQIRHPCLVSGNVSHNIFQNINGIAVFNSRNCIGNLIGRCQLAFLWHIDFLENYANA